MPRAKTRVASRQRRKKVLLATRGYFGKKANCFAIANDAFWRAGKYNYRDRRQRRRQFRSLWILRINAGARQNGVTYARLINGLKQNNIELNRKSLAHLAMHEPMAFSKIVAAAVTAN